MYTRTRTRTHTHTHMALTETLRSVVYHDGTHWRAVLDVDESADLSARQPMADFHVEKQFGFFADRDHCLLSYAVNVYDEGRVLSVVTVAGSHGTHVAGIVGAHYPDAPDMNGVAPGCQIVSLKVGDSRMGSMETGRFIRTRCIHLAHPFFTRHGAGARAGRHRAPGLRRPQLELWRAGRRVQRALQ